MSKYLLKDKPALQKRDLSYVPADMNAVKCLVQAAVNVELFTIPLYMTSLYSIYGMHQINAADSSFYQGRLWPGMSATPGAPGSLTPNQDAFNKVFGIFIAEMLHLQLASNICKAVGHDPLFTSPMLQNPDHSWNCYGESCTSIPHVLDLQDTFPSSKFHNLKVKLDSLNATQILLFLAIEQTENDAEQNVDPAVWKAKYSPSVPFDWTKDKTEADLPMFGTIGQMYTCLWEYLSIQYTDDTSLWSKMFVSGAIQQDIFNKGVAKPQYPLMSVKVDTSDSETAAKQVLDMIDGITDQGEGSGVGAKIRKRLALPPVLTAVKDKYQPSEDGLATDYPSYNDTGEQLPQSASAAARAGANGGMDHFELFTAVQKLIAQPDFKTWDTWHKDNPTWSPSDLITNQADYETNRTKYPQLPSADDICGALNRLNPFDAKANLANYQLFSRISTGSVAGMTTVLDNYWKDPTAKFPSPAMGGTADRMSICWAIFGKAPDLSLAADGKKATVLYHACQGLSLDPNSPVQEWGCAAPSVYHTCIGSNDCHSQGGCGFVQSTSGGGNCSGGGGGCGAKALRAKTVALKAGCAPQTYSAPSDNKCVAFGGCAVPISASQMYPAPKGPMLYYDYTQDSTGKWTSVELQGWRQYQEGQLVYDVAWEAYTAVLLNRKVEPPAKPAPNDIRLAFPPST